MTVLSASLPRAVLLGATLLPGAALADLAPADVWQHFKDVSTLYGGTLEGATSEQGDTLSVSDMNFALDLPFDAGKLDLDLGAVQFREGSGGTVTLLYPSEMMVKVTYTSKEGETFGGDINMTLEDFVSTASGQPGEITFDYAADRIGVELDVPNLPEGLESYSASGFLADVTGSSAQTLASGLKADSRISIGAHEFTASQSMSLEDEDGRVEVKSSSGGDSLTAEGKTVIPAGGIDLVNLASALRSGLSAIGTADVTGYRTDQVSAKDGAVIARQRVTAASYATTFSLDDTGVLIEGPSEDLRLEIEMPTMGGMLFGANIDSVSGTMRAPLLMEDAFAPAEVKLDLVGLSPDETLWGMFDPTGILPRDPADLSLELTADIRHRVEWLDFANVESAVDALSGLPVEPESAQLNKLRISAAGAEVTGEGAFTFDLTDLQSFDGLPRPEGKLTLRAKGLNALAQKLVKLGMPEDQINGGLMMLGMFSASDPEGGEDARITVLEVTPDGQVLNNGMRLR